MVYIDSGLENSHPSTTESQQEKMSTRGKEKTTMIIKKGTIPGNYRLTTCLPMIRKILITKMRK